MNRAKQDKHESAVLVVSSPVPAAAAVAVSLDAEAWQGRAEIGHLDMQGPALSAIHSEAIPAARGVDR